MQFTSHPFRQILFHVRRIAHNLQFTSPSCSHRCHRSSLAESIIIKAFDQTDRYKLILLLCSNQSKVFFPRHYLLISLRITIMILSMCCQSPFMMPSMKGYSTGDCSFERLKKLLSANKQQVILFARNRFNSLTRKAFRGRFYPPKVQLTQNVEKCTSPSLVY